MNPRSENPKSSRKGESTPPTSNAGKAPGPFDVRTVEVLVALMTQHDLSEIALRDGNQRLRLRRGAQTQPSIVPAPMPTASALAPPPAAASPASSQSPAQPAKNLFEIKSPTPGTFYSSAKPGEPPFVKVGSKVSAESVVCLIEAMKVFNEIQAEVAGAIVEIAVENQQPVEYGQVLFRVDPAG